MYKALHLWDPVRPNSLNKPRYGRAIKNNFCTVWGFEMHKFVKFRQKQMKLNVYGQLHDDQRNV